KSSATWSLKVKDGSSIASGLLISFAIGAADSRRFSRMSISSSQAKPKKTPSVSTAKAICPGELNAPKTKPIPLSDFLPRRRAELPMFDRTNSAGQRIASHQGNARPAGDEGWHSGHDH